MASAEPKYFVFSEAELHENTEFKNKPLMYNWSIKNFSTYLDRKYELSSRTFSNFQGGESQWKLMACRKHVYSKGAMLAVRLVKMSENKKSYRVKYKLWIETKKGFKNMLLKEKMFREHLDFDEDIIASHKELMNENLLQYGSLILRCELNVLVDETDLNRALYPCLPSTSRHNDCMEDQPTNIRRKFTVSELLEFSDEEDGTNATLSEDREELYETRMGADVVLLCEGFQIEAHKYILEERSNYFKKLFRSESGEQNAVIISDVDFSILDTFLYFLYTDKICNMSFNLAVDMLSAGEFFEVNCFRARLLACLKKCITVDNVIDQLLYCESLDEDELKCLCMRFITIHYSDVFKSEAWQSLLKSNITKANDIMSYVQSQKNLNVSCSVSDKS